LPLKRFSLDWVERFHKITTPLTRNAAQRDLGRWHQ